MNTYFKKWIEEALVSIEGEFTAKHILTRIVDKHGTSPYVGTVTAIGWYLTKLDNVEQVCKGYSSKTYRKV
tara:strand:- start:8127 stop:8339 length:213 start_codon:yes stop_codon:yes gene_type:complete